MSEPEKKEGIPYWAHLLLACLVGLIVSQCVSTQFKLASISSDVFGVKLKLDRIERKIEGLRP